MPIARSRSPRAASRGYIVATVSALPADSIVNGTAPSLARGPIDEVIPAWGPYNGSYEGGSPQPRRPVATIATMVWTKAQRSVRRAHSVGSSSVADELPR